MTVARCILRLLLLAQLLLLSACGAEMAGNATSAPAELQNLPPELKDSVEDLKAVEMVRVGSAQDPILIEAPSALIVENDVEVMSRLTGIIEEILVDRGQRVSRGDVLARIENRDLALVAESEEKSYQLARLEFERAKALAEKDVISPQDYDTKRLEAERAEADWRLAKVEFEKTFIKAPFDGVVSERYVRLGQRVVEDASTPLFRVTALEPLLARFYLPEAQMRQIQIGDRVAIRAKVASGREHEGRVRWISPIVDAASGTFQAIAEVHQEEPDPFLCPGLAVTVGVSLAVAPVAVRVERGALAERGLLTEGNHAQLFVVEDGHAVLRSVRVGRVWDQEVEILSGLREGEMVVRPFRQDLEDGEPVGAAYSR